MSRESQAPQGAAARPILEGIGLTKIFRMGKIETTAVSEVDLCLRRGDFVSIMGRSGSGKSTLLSLLGLMETPSAGQLIAFGRDVGELSRADRAMLRNRHLGFVFQFFHLIADLSVEENIALPMLLAGRAREHVRARVDELTERLSIAHRKTHRPIELSGGQQQRVAVARAIANRPDLLLLDEPTGNLDTENAEALIELLEELNNEGLAICLVTHDPSLAQRAARRLLMTDGSLATH